MADILEKIKQLEIDNLQEELSLLQTYLEFLDSFKAKIQAIGKNTEQFQSLSTVGLIKKHHLFYAQTSKIIFKIETHDLVDAIQEILNLSVTITTVFSLISSADKDNTGFFLKAFNNFAGYVEKGGNFLYCQLSEVRALLTRFHIAILMKDNLDDIKLDINTLERYREKLRSETKTESPQGVFFLKLLRFDAFYFLDEFLDGIFPPNKQPPLRKQSIGKGKYTVTGNGIFARSQEDMTTECPLKMPQYTSVEKKGYSNFQPTTMGTSKVYPPFISRENSSINVGVIMQEKNILYSSRLLSNDIGTVNRPYDFDNLETAEYFFKYRKEKESLFSNTAEELKKFIAKIEASNKINEALVRIKATADDGLQIFIGEDNLESRITAQQYAKDIKKRLVKHAMCDFNYEVKIIFYTPSNKKMSFREYTPLEQYVDIKKAELFRCNDSNKNHRSFVTLLALNHNLLMKEISENPKVLNNIITQKYFHVLNVLFQKLNDDELNSLFEILTEHSDFLLKLTNPDEKFNEKIDRIRLFLQLLVPQNKRCTKVSDKFLKALCEFLLKKVTVLPGQKKVNSRNIMFLEQTFIDYLFNKSLLEAYIHNYMIKKDWVEFFQSGYDSLLNKELFLSFILSSDYLSSNDLDESHLLLKIVDEFGFGKACHHLINNKNRIYWLDIIYKKWAPDDERENFSLLFLNAQSSSKLEIDATLFFDVFENGSYEIIRFQKIDQEIMEKIIDKDEMRFLHLCNKIFTSNNVDLISYFVEHVLFNYLKIKQIDVINLLVNHFFKNNILYLFEDFEFENEDLNSLKPVQSKIIIASYLIDLFAQSNYEVENFNRLKIVSADESKNKLDLKEINSKLNLCEVSFIDRILYESKIKRHWNPDSRNNMLQLLSNKLSEHVFATEILKLKIDSVDKTKYELSGETIELLFKTDMLEIINSTFLFLYEKLKHLKFEDIDIFTLKSSTTDKTSIFYKWIISRLILDDYYEEIPDEIPLASDSVICVREMDNTSLNITQNSSFLICPLEQTLKDQKTLKKYLDKLESYQLKKIVEFTIGCNIFEYYLVVLEVLSTKQAGEDNIKDIAMYVKNINNEDFIQGMEKQFEGTEYEKIVREVFLESDKEFTTKITFTSTDYSNHFFKEEKVSKNNYYTDIDRNTDTLFKDDILSQVENVENIDLSSSYELYEHLKAKKDFFEKKLDKKELILINYIFDNHLNKPYKNSSRSMLSVKDDTTIYRPNHGLAHTMRKLFYIKPVIKYLEKYVADENLRDIYKKYLSDGNEFFKLKCIVAFLVTGREGEESFSSNKTRYLSYKQQSAENFQNYMAKLSEAELNEYVCLIKNIGNPDYCKEEKRSYREKALYHACTFIHNLDLFRCYNKSAFITAINDYQETTLIQKSENQKDDFFQLIELASNLVCRTGNRVCTVYDSSSGSIKNLETSRFYDVEKFLFYSVMPCLSFYLMKELVSRLKKDLSFDETARVDEKICEEEMPSNKMRLSA